MVTHQTLIENYAVELNRTLGSEPAWLTEQRSEAKSRALALGWPTPRQEEWKYTQIEPFLRSYLGVPAKPSNDEVAALKAQAALPGMVTLTFADGCYLPELSNPALPAGIEFQPSSAVLRHNDGASAADWQAINLPNHALAWLNSAFMRDGAWLRVRKGTNVTTPIQLLFLSTTTAAKRASYLRNRIVVQAGARVTIVETHLGAAETPNFSDAVSHLSLHEGAAADHTRVQIESESALNYSLLAVEQRASSSFKSRVFNLGARLARNEITVRLLGEEAQCTLDGLFVAHGEQHIDNRTAVHHEEPNCTSEEVYKGILADHSSGVFNGKIIVYPNAQKTDAKQSNKNLLLSANAVMNSKPQLEIFADDVRCTHGATVGQLDDDALFYLRSRGFSAGLARQVLTYAFAGELIDAVPIDELRAFVSQRVRERLSAAEDAGLEGAP